MVEVEELVFFHDDKRCSLMRTNGSATEERRLLGTQRKWTQIRSSVLRKLDFRLGKKTDKGSDHLTSSCTTCKKQADKLHQGRSTRQIIEDNETLCLESRKEFREDNHLNYNLHLKLKDATEVSRLLYDPRVTREQVGEIGPVQYDVVEKLGRQVGQYILGKPLGEGSFGQVWSGKNEHSTTTTEELAIKSVDKLSIRYARHLAQLNLECFVLRKHSYHPNIIGFYGVIHATDFIYVIMEKAQDPLMKYSAQMRHQPDFLQQVTLGVLRGLQCLHGNGISHGDIHPNNIMITLPKGICIGADAVRLCDFGLAHSQKVNLGKFHCLGGFLAPELRRDPDNVLDRCKCDMWSLGGCMLEMRNRFPANHTGFQELQRKWGMEACHPEQFFDHEGDYLENDFIFNRLLPLDPQKRASSTEALEHSWFQFKAFPPPNLL